MNNNLLDICKEKLHYVFSFFMKPINIKKETVAYASVGPQNVDANGTEV